MMNRFQTLAFNVKRVVRPCNEAMTGMNDAAGSLGLSDGSKAAAGPDDADVDEEPPPGAIEEGVTHLYQWTQEGEDVVVTVQAGEGRDSLSHRSTTLSALNVSNRRTAVVVSAIPPWDNHTRVIPLVLDSDSARAELLTREATGVR
jgi:hypothetical protein